MKPWTVSDDPPPGCPRRIKPADPIPSARDNTIEVLVIEQSESTRSALTDILARQHVRASFAGDVDEA
jgi:hypothetical protein